MFAEILDAEVHGDAPLLAPAPGIAERTPLHVAIVIPPFRRGSGGHDTIFRVFREIERLGHTVSVWIDDPEGRHASEWPAVVRDNIREWFAPLEAPVFKGFEDWYGADVALATGWQTVFPVLRLEDCRARAYFVQDHEPEFYATAAEARWAAETYRRGLHHICASPWLAQLVRERYGGTASVFQLGADGDIYRPIDVARRRDTVVFYGRAVTSRRAVPLGLLALAELKRRRPQARVVIYGDTIPERHLVPLRVRGRRLTGRARAPLLRGDRRALPLDDQLLARAAGDDGLRAAVRGPRGLQLGVGLRRGRPGRAERVQPLADRRPHRAADGRRGALAAALGRRARVRRRAHLAGRRARGRRRGCARRCACASARRAAPGR